MKWFVTNTAVTYSGEEGGLSLLSVVKGFRYEAYRRQQCITVYFDDDDYDGGSGDEGVYIPQCCVATLLQSIQIHSLFCDIRGVTKGSRQFLRKIDSNRCTPSHVLEDWTQH